MTLKEKFHAYLIKHGRITSKQARKLWGVRNPRDIVYRLRNDKIAVITNTSIRKGQTHVVYTLDDSKLSNKEMRMFLRGDPQAREALYAVA